MGASLDVLRDGVSTPVLGLEHHWYPVLVHMLQQVGSRVIAVLVEDVDLAPGPQTTDQVLPAMQTQQTHVLTNVLT